MKPMDSMEEYGTMAFSPQYMNAFVGYGEPKYDNDKLFMGFDEKANPSKLNLSVWLGLVPSIFKEMVLIVVESKWSEYRNEDANGTNKMLFCEEVCEEIVRCIKRSDHFQTEIRKAKLRRAEQQNSQEMGD
jgi:hypothetical protein